MGTFGLPVRRALPYTLGFLLLKGDALRSFPITLVSVGLGLALLGCPKRVGSQSELAPTAREKVAEAKRQADSGKTDEALKLLEQVPQDNQQVAEVLFEVGEAKLAARDFVAARKSLRDLLAGFPLFDKAALAKQHLALAQLELKEYRDALQTLTTLYPRVAEADKPQVASDLARAAEGARQWADSPQGSLVTVFFLEGGRPTFGPRAAELTGAFYRNLWDSNWFAAKGQQDSAAIPPAPSRQAQP